MVKSINSNNNFFGVYQSEIAHSVMIAPICFEVGRFLYKVKRQDDSLKYLKKCTRELFNKSSNETHKEFRARQVKVVFKTAIIIASLAAVVFGFPFVSHIYTVSIAISVISSFVKIYVHRKEVCKKFSSFKHKIIKTYSLNQANSSEKRKKVLKNYLITAIAMIALGATTATMFTLLHPFVAAPAVLIGSIAILHLIKSGKEIFTKKTDETNFQRNLRIVFYLTLMSAMIISACLLPELSNQVKQCLAQLNKGERWVTFESSFKMVYLEHLVIGLTHLAYSMYYLAKKNKKLAFFHFINSLIGILTPLGRINEINPRLHHDFSGLVLSLAPFRALKLLGAGYTLDSLGYYIYPDRSYLQHSSYDFVNVILEYNLFSYIILASAIQKTSENLLEIINKKRKEDEEKHSLMRFLTSIRENFRKLRVNISV